MRSGKTMLHLLCAAALGLGSFAAGAPAIAQSAEARLAAYRERVERTYANDDYENLSETMA